MHNQRIAVIISAIVGIIGTFLPYMKSWFNSVSLIETKDGFGYIVLAAFAISIIVAFLGNYKYALNKGQLIGTIIPGVIPGFLLILLVLSRLNDDLVRVFTNFEIGFYVVVLASMSILILGLLLKDTTESIPITSNDHTLFCSGCGKKYSSKLAGEFCEECGNKL